VGPTTQLPPPPASVLRERSCQGLCSTLPVRMIIHLRFSCSSRPGAIGLLQAPAGDTGQSRIGPELAGLVVR